MTFRHRYFHIENLYWHLEKLSTQIVPWKYLQNNQSDTWNENSTKTFVVALDNNKVTSDGLSNAVHL